MVECKKSPREFTTDQNWWDEVSTVEEAKRSNGTMFFFGFHKYFTAIILCLVRINWQTGPKTVWRFHPIEMRNDISFRSDFNLVYLIMSRQFCYHKCEHGLMRQWMKSVFRFQCDAGYIYLMLLVLLVLLLHFVYPNINNTRNCVIYESVWAK